MTLKKARGLYCLFRRGMKGTAGRLVSWQKYRVFTRLRCVLGGRVKVHVHVRICLCERKREREGESECE